MIRQTNNDKYRVSKYKQILCMKFDQKAIKALNSK